MRDPELDALVEQLRLSNERRHTLAVAQNKLVSEMKQIADDCRLESGSRSAAISPSQILTADAVAECAERIRLIDRWRKAAAFYSYTVQELRRLTQSDNFAEALRLTNDAHCQSAVSQAEYNEHIAVHGCIKTPAHLELRNP